METALLNKEKIQIIIDRLQQQLAENAGKEKMLLTAQLLAAEIGQPNKQARERQNVAVVMPVTIEITREMPLPEPVKASVPETKEAAPTEETVIISSQKEPAARQPEAMPAQRNTVPEEKHFHIWEAFGIAAEPPTITHYQPKEETAELNEKYTDRHKKELGQSLQSTPIHDLTAVVGINDRYLYINELFRGDESMFERSIITLNKFHTYEQACSWIDRELRLKLGWDVENLVTRQFEALIRRRFL